MGRLVFHQEDLEARDAPVVFDIGSYPLPPPPDPRSKKVATERMLWRNTGALAAAVGHEYFEEDEPRLITHADWLVLQEPAPDPSPKRGRRTK